MADKLLLHSIDACTRTAGRDPLLKSQYTPRKLVVLYVEIIIVGVIAVCLWGMYLEGMM